MSRLRSLAKLVGRVLVVLVGSVFLLALGFYLFENRAPNYRTLDPTEIARLTAVLQTHGEPPASYVLHKFADHSVVILGEPHRIREHYEFLAGLLPLLPDAGVHQVAIEFFQRSNQPQIDQLLAGATFDESLARRIVLSGARYFYYEELYAVLRKAWEVNRSGRHLRILSLYWRPHDPEVHRRAGDLDLLMAETVIRAVEEGGKTLVYCGVHHAFTSYLQPGILGLKGPVKMGNYLNFLRTLLGKAPFFINLYYPVFKEYWPFAPTSLYWKGWCLPFGGALEQLFQAYSAPVGFDTAYKEFDPVVDTFSYYAQDRRELRLSDFCDGYIYLNPIDQYHFVRPLHGIAASEEDRETLRTILGEQLQKQYFGSEAAAVSFVQSEGIIGIMPQGLLDVDLRGLENAFPAPRTRRNSR